MTSVTLGTSPPEVFNADDFVGPTGQGHVEDMAAAGSRPTEPRFMRAWARMVESLGVAEAAVSLAGFTGTSSSSVAIGTGSKSFTTQSGKGWFIGQGVAIYDTAAPTTNYMLGTVTSYSSTTLQVSVATVGGSGTISSWSIGPKQGDLSGPGSSVDYSLAAANGTSGKIVRFLASWLADASDNLNASDKILSRAALKDTSEVVQTVTVSSGTTNIDIESGNVVTLVHNQDTTLVFQNPSGSGRACWLHMRRVKDNSGTARALTYPSSVRWPGGDGLGGPAPVLTQTANAVDFMSFVTFDNGTNWYGFLGGLAFA